MLDSSVRLWVLINIDTVGNNSQRALGFRKQFPRCIHIQHPTLLHLALLLFDCLLSCAWSVSYWVCYGSPGTSQSGCSAGDATMCRCSNTVISIKIGDVPTRQCRPCCVPVWLNWPCYYIVTFFPYTVLSLIPFLFLVWAGRTRQLALWWPLQFQSGRPLKGEVPCAY